MSRAFRTLAGACAALVLAACSTSDGGGSGNRGTVPWRDYAPSLQARIDEMARAKNCDGLQLEFNEIGATNLAMRTNFGHGNVEVLNYIGEKEREANCFSIAS